MVFLDKLARYLSCFCGYCHVPEVAYKNTGCKGRTSRFRLAGECKPGCVYGVDSAGVAVWWDHLSLGLSDGVESYHCWARPSACICACGAEFEADEEPYHTPKNI